MRFLAAVGLGACCRYGACAQLVSEQEVQALSIDAARTNVEAHFSYICGAFEGFMQRYLAQHAVHAGGCGSASVHAGDR